MSFFNRSKTKILKQVDVDIWDYCFLNPFKYNNYLRRSFAIKYNRVSLSKQELESASILVKADKRLKKLFLKKKSYFSKLLLLKRKLRLFFNFFTHSLIEKFFVGLFVNKGFYRRNFDESLSLGIETFLFFFLIRLRYTFSFFEAESLIKQGVVLVNEKVVYDSFFNISIGDIVSFKFSFGKQFFYKKHYIYWFNEFLRQGILFNKILSQYILKNFYVSSNRKGNFKKELFYLKSFDFHFFNTQNVTSFLSSVNFLIRNVYCFKSFLYSSNSFLDTRIFRKGFLDDKNVIKSAICSSPLGLEIKSYGRIRMMNINVGDYTNIFEYLTRQLQVFNLVCFFFKFYYCFISLKKIVQEFLLARIKKLIKFHLLSFKLFSFYLVYFIIFKTFVFCFNLFFFKRFSYFLLISGNNTNNNPFFLYFYLISKNFLDSMKLNTNFNYFFFFFLKFSSISFNFLFNFSMRNFFSLLIFKKLRVYKRFFLHSKKFSFYNYLDNYFSSNKLLDDFLLTKGFSEEIFLYKNIEFYSYIFGKRLSKSFSLWNYDLIEKAFNYNDFVLRELKKKKQINLLKGKNYMNILWKDDRDLKVFNRMISLYKFKLNNIQEGSLKKLEDSSYIYKDGTFFQKGVLLSNENTRNYEMLQTLVKDLKSKLK